MAYDVTREELEKEINSNKIRYDIGISGNSYSLFITLHENHGYRIATYSAKTGRITLTCPEWHIPQKKVLEEFLECCKTEIELGEKNG